MNVKKEKSLDKLYNENKMLTDLVITQIQVLREILSTKETKISEETYKQLKVNEEQIDHLEITISERVVNNIALYNPVAGDIRKIMAIYRISINLERIGDIVMNIVHFLYHTEKTDLYFKLIDSVEHMLNITFNMVQKATQSFIDKDKEYAIWAIKNDELVDEMNKTLMKKAIKKSDIDEQTSRLLLNYLSLSSMISNIERIGDHATNIAEAAIYATKGEDIRHQDI